MNYTRSRHIILSHQSIPVGASDRIYCLTVPSWSLVPDRERPLNNVKDVKLLAFDDEIRHGVVSRISQGVVHRDGNAPSARRRVGAIDHVVISTDGSEFDDRAAADPLPIVEQSGATVNVIYVVDKGIYDI